MNKKLLTLAIAAALAAPAIAPSTASAEAIVYGKVNVSIDYADVKNVVLPTYGLVNGSLAKTADGEDFTGWGMSSNGYIPGEGRASRLGLKGSEDLGNGLKAIYQLEFGVNLNDTNDNVTSNSDSITYRNSFVGLAGDWGTLLMGRHDTPMKISTGKLDLFADTMADYNGTVGFRDLRADNAVAYMSPSMSGFQLAAAIIPAGGATGGGRGLNLEENSIAGAYSLAGIYSNGPFYASAAWEALGNQHFNTLANSSNDCPNVVTYPDNSFTSYCNYNESDVTAWRLGLGLLDWNGFTLAGVYEHQDNLATATTTSDTYVSYTDPNDPSWNASIPGAPDHADLWQIQAGYAFGNSMVKAMYGQAAYDADYSLGATYSQYQGGPIYVENTSRNMSYDTSTWGIGYDYNFSKRTKAYALYTDVTSDQSDIKAGSEWSGFSLGMMHSF
jgi:predicted porin